MALWLCTWVTGPRDRKSTRLNSSHVAISYAVFCFASPVCLHSFPTRRSSDLGCHSHIDSSAGGGFVHRQLAFCELTALDCHHCYRRTVVGQHSLAAAHP